MPASLIDSQFAALESPEGEGDVVTIPADADLAQTLDATIERLTRATAGRSAASPAPGGRFG